MRLGVFGGSFNPVHNGHVTLAGEVMLRLELAKVVFVPANVPPHRKLKALAPGEHRLAMLRLALADEPAFDVSDTELTRGGSSYTIDTIREFQTADPGGEVFFIVGADSIPELPHWKDAAELVRLCTIVTVGRPGADRPFRESLAGRLPDDCIDKLEANRLDTALVDISSTDIRDRVRRGLPITDLVPAAVADYIRQHQLYA